MEKEDVVYTCSEIIFSHEEERNPAIAATWMDLERVMLNETGQRKTNTGWYHAYMQSKKNSEK